MSIYQAIGCPTVSSKVNLLYKQKDKCNSYVDIFSDEHGERFHKKMPVTEKRFKRFKECLNIEMLAECTFCVKSTRNSSFKRPA